METLLTVFGIEWELLVIETINFLIVLGGLSYFLYRPVLKLLKEREQKIAQGIKDAETAAQAAEETEGKRVEILTSATHEAEGIVDRAAQEGKEERQRIVKLAQERSDAAIADAQKQAEELKRRALSDSEKEVARIAILAAEKLLHQK